MEFRDVTAMGPGGGLGNEKYRADDPLVEARRAFDNGAFARAVALVEPIVHEDPGTVDAWNLLASAQISLGESNQAAATLRQALTHNPSAASLHNNLAALCHAAGEQRLTEIHLREAVKAEPRFAEAWISLGKIGAATGDLRGAEHAFRTAVDAAPNQSEPLLELAKFVFVCGRFDEAERLLDAFDSRSGLFTPEAPPAAPTVAALRLEIASRMAEAYLKIGRPQSALGHLEQAIALGGGQAAETRFLGMLLGARFSAPRPSLKPLLRRALEEHWADPIEVGRLAAHLMLLEDDFRILANRLQTSFDGIDAPVGLDGDAVQRVLADPLLLSLLTRTLVADPAMERFLVALRRSLLRRVATSTSLQGNLTPIYAFVGALANQCFANEYAFALADDEAIAHADLSRRCAAALARGEAPEPLPLAVMAAYASLGEWAAFAGIANMHWPAWFDTVVQRQVREPLEEARLRMAIPQATGIRDPASLAVQRQYEDNPYPRWIDVAGRPTLQSPSVWLRRTFPQASLGGLATPEKRNEILLAGCGTGREAVAFGLMFSEVDLFAVDLSMTSLAYGARKAAELGVANLTFARGDLLEMPATGREFDVVVCAGVLHHLGDPLLGWRALKDVTRAGGVMLIALYSDLARRELRGARDFADRGGYGVSADELRRYRADVINLDVSPSPPWRDHLLRRGDFYSLSTVRDLVFHVRETCFTIDRIGGALESLGLRFGGFALSAEVAVQFGQRFAPKADPLSLAQWRIFETENPDTFSRMYHFLVERP